MPVGIKISEVDASLYSTSRNVSPSLAIVGTATKGPIGVPTLCISQRDLRTKFGPQNPNCMGLYAGNYFLTQSARLYFTRVAKDAKLAEVTIPGTDNTGTTVNDLLVLEAESAGTFYNGYKVVISDAISTGFTLTVKTPEDRVVCICKHVTLDAASPRYFKKLLEANSPLRVKSLNMLPANTYILTDGTYDLADGDDGITGLTSSEYIAGLDEQAPDTMDIELLAVPGVTDAEVVTKGLSIAETRGDCLFLVDPPAGLDYEDAIAWHNGTGDYDDHAAFNSSYGAMYWSWQYIYDEVTDQEVLVPPSVVVAATIAYSDSISQKWYAPAGLTRGVIKNALRSEFIPDSSVQDLVYSDPNNINPIITHANSGLVIFGQKTLHRTTTALDRVNVRRLLCYIKRFLKDICKTLVFEPNDEATWNSFEDLATPRLRTIQTDRGIYDFKIIKGENIITDEDIDNYRMPVQVLIKPTKTAEYIPVDLVITSTGAEFNEYNSAYSEEN